MKERPILFSAPMVRALLDGSKTQTRRVAKPQPAGEIQRQVPGLDHWIDSKYWERKQQKENLGIGTRGFPCPYGKTGDRLWVRETFSEADMPDGTPIIAYRADGNCIAIGRDEPKGPDFLLHKYTFVDQAHVDKWTPSIFMPRWSSRITLEITGVRVERLQDISEDACWAEGVEQVMHDFPDASQIDMAYRLGLCIEDAKPLYAQLWESINGPGSWDAHPWVWVIQFKRVQL